MAESWTTRFVTLNKAEGSPANASLRGVTKLSWERIERCFVPQHDTHWGHDIARRLGPLPVGCHVEGVAADFVFVESVPTTKFTLEKLPAGRKVTVRVTAANGARERGAAECRTGLAVSRVILREPKSLP